MVACVRLRAIGLLKRRGLSLARRVSAHLLEGRVLLDWQPVAAEIRSFDAEDCKMYRWRTDESGLIWVSKDGGPEFVPTLRGPNASGMDRVVSTWGQIAHAAAARWGLPATWLLSMIWRESGGNARAIRHEPNGWTGVGLMQITHPSLKGGLSDEAVFDPKTNVEIGARYIAKQLVTRYGQDFPKISAAFNAGSVRPSDKNEWHMVCTGNHVDAEVGAVNYQILATMAVAANAMAVQFDLAGLIDLSPHASET